MIETLKVSKKAVEFLQCIFEVSVNKFAYLVKWLKVSTRNSCPDRVFHKFINKTFLFYVKQYFYYNIFIIFQ